MGDLQITLLARKQEDKEVGATRIGTGPRLQLLPTLKKGILVPRYDNS